MPVSSDPIIGRWSLTSGDGITVTVTFLEDGTFSGTIEGEPSPEGTWELMSGNEYAVTLSTDETWTYIYNAESDSIYDVSFPKDPFTRQ